MKKKFSEQYSKEFVDALQNEKVPGNKFTVSEMARYIATSAKLGVELSPKEAAQMVREDYEERHRALYGNADAEYLVKILGEETLQKIRAHDMAKLKNPEQNLRTPQEQSGLQRQRGGGGETKRMNHSEWRAYNRK